MLQATLKMRQSGEGSESDQSSEYNSLTHEDTEEAVCVNSSHTLTTGLIAFIHQLRAVFKDFIQ